MISLRALAHELQIDASGLRKRIVANGISIHTVKQNNRLCNGLSDEDATVIRSWHKDIKDCGNNTLKSSKDDTATSCRPVTVYVIQLVPDLQPKRIKVGVADSIDARLSQHRTTCPTLSVLRLYTASPAHESILIQLLCSKEKQIGTEVFDVQSIEQTLTNIDTFFFILGIEPSFKV